MTENAKISRVGIQEVIARMKKHPQAERLEKLTIEDIRNTINILWDSIVDSLKDGKDGSTVEVSFLKNFTFTTRVIKATEARKGKMLGKDMDIKASPEHKRIVVRVAPSLRKSFKEDTSK